MAALVIDGVTIPVALNQFAEVEPLEIGERVRTFEGGLRVTVRARKRRWRGTTRLLSPAEYSDVRDALDALSASCSGDLLGATFTCAPRVVGEAKGKAGGAIRGGIEFELEEV